MARGKLRIEWDGQSLRTIRVFLNDLDITEIVNKVELKMEAGKVPIASVGFVTGIEMPEGLPVEWWTTEYGEQAFTGWITPTPEPEAVPSD